MKDINTYFVELGFRFNDKKIKGLTAYTSDKTIQKLNIPKNINIGIMINASDLLENNHLDLSVLKRLININSSKKLSLLE